MTDEQSSIKPKVAMAGLLALSAGALSGWYNSEPECNVQKMARHCNIINVQSLPLVNLSLLPVEITTINRAL